MYVTLVQVRVKPEHVQEFIAATEANHLQSVHEKGNLRFDLLQAPDDPCRFLLYEAYATAADAVPHKSTDYYKRWRDTVADWKAEPRKATVYEGLLPQN